MARNRKPGGINMTGVLYAMIPLGFVLLIGLFLLIGREGPGLDYPPPQAVTAPVLTGPEPGTEDDLSNVPTAATVAEE